jgi:branched-chain amino acid transport system substrate-binding protein
MTMQGCKQWIVGLAMATAIGSPLLAQTASPPNNALKIGVIGPFSGASSDFGTQMLQGVQLAVDEINAVGGYMGRLLTLVVKDDQGNPDTGLQGSKELVAEGVVATIGFCNTGVAMKALEVYQQAKLPLIVPCSTGTPLTAKFPAPESYIFRTSPRDAIQAPFVVQEILTRGWDKVAIFADTTGYGEAGLQDVQSALTKRGLKPVHVARFALGVKDLQQELTAARDAGANVIFSYTVGVENATIANGRKSLKWNVPQVGAWPLSFPFFINGAKDAAEGALMAQTFIAEPSNERRASFLTAFKRKFNKPMTVPMAAAQAYDTTYILAYSLFNIRNNDLSGPSIKSALENMPRTYYGVVTTYERPFSLNDKDAITSNMLVIGKVRDGKVTFAHPEDASRNLTVQRKKPSP